MGGGSRRGAEPFSFDPVLKGMKGTDAFKNTFADDLTQMQDSGMMRSSGGRGGLFGSGLSGEDFVNVLTRAAALASGDYGGAAQIGQLIRRPQREQAERDNAFEDWRKRFDYEAGNTPAKTPTPYRWEDNAGNQWEMDPATGEQRRFFTDRAPKQFISDGQLITSTNPYLNEGSTPGVPKGYDPDVWEVVPGPQQGGPTPSASGGFPGQPPRRRNRGY